MFALILLMLEILLDIFSFKSFLSNRLLGMFKYGKVGELSEENSLTGSCGTYRIFVVLKR